MRRPTLETMRSMTLRRWSSELNRDSVSVELAVPLDVDLVHAG